MPKFFVENIEGTVVTLTGQSAAHIAKSLRMKVGEEVVLCDGKGYDYGCIIEQIDKEKVVLTVAFQTPSESESDIVIDVYQGLPKGDKLSEVVRKCTELGAGSFHPVVMKRSVVKPDAKSAEKKLARLKKVAGEAAEQSRRGKIPAVFTIEPYEKALEQISAEKTILFYENGGQKLKEILIDFKRENVKSVALLIGPEGGFDEAEVALAKEKGAVIATLGKRILRTETAPVAAVANVLYELEN